MSTSAQQNGKTSGNFRITRFNKAIVSGLATVLNVFVAVMGDDVVNMTEKQQIVTTLVTVGVGIWAVYRVPNAKDNAEVAK